LAADLRIRRRVLDAGSAGILPAMGARARKQ
jgi:hypothetical protein